MSEYRRVPKLNGAENYHRWEVLLRSTLVVNHCFRVVKPDYVPPCNPDAKANTTVPAAPTNTRDSYQDYLRWENEALGAIRRTCKPGPRARIENIETAQQAWAMLKDLYGTPTFAMRERATLSLVSLKAESFNDPRDYLGKFMTHANVLRRAGDPLSNSQEAIFFKKGLPRCLHSFVVALYESCLQRGEAIDLTNVAIALSNHPYWQRRITDAP